MDGQPRTATSTLTQLLNYEFFSTDLETNMTRIALQNSVGVCVTHAHLLNVPTKFCRRKRRKKWKYFIVQELCESRGGRPGLSVLTSLLVSVDVKLY